MISNNAVDPIHHRFMGFPAARLGDVTAHGGTITVGMPTVLIGGQPAARIGDMHVCPMVTVIVPHVGGPLVLGAFTVLTGGVPQSRQTDMLVCVGPPDMVAMGCPTVLVGMVGGGGALSMCSVLGGLFAGFSNLISNLMASAFVNTPLDQLKHAREMAKFARSVYDNSGAPAGSRRLSDDPSSLPPNLRNFPFRDPQSGFDSALYETDDGRIIVAYRGTEGPDRRDWETNLRQGLGFQSDQHDSAVDLARRVQDAYPDREVEITGHSLGGGLAETASASTGYPATTFNAGGTHDNTFERYNTDSSNVNSTNYTVDGEVLTSAQESSLTPMPRASGDRVPLDARDSNGRLLSPNPVARHSMDSVDSSLDHAITQASLP